MLKQNILWDFGLNSIYSMGWIGCHYDIVCQFLVSKSWHHGLKIVIFYKNRITGNKNPIQMSYYQTPIKSNARKQAKNYTQDKEKPTDWICMVCNNLNFSFRKKCNRCKTQTRTQNQNQIANVYSDYYYSNQGCFTAEKRVFADLTNCQTPEQKYQHTYSQKSVGKILPFVLCHQSNNMENSSYSMNDIHSERKLENVLTQQFSSDKLANQQWNKFQTQLNEDQIRTNNDNRKFSLNIPQQFSYDQQLQKQRSYSSIIGSASSKRDTFYDSQDLDIQVQIQRGINRMLLDDQ